MRQRLPIGIQDFRTLREGNYLYVDKTRYIHRMCTQGGPFFLARPRRFGKSLTLTTIQELYRGRKDLFAGLWIEDQWDWGRKHPVVRISMKAISYLEFGLAKALTNELHGLGRALEVPMPAEGVRDCFTALLKTLHAREGKVVILIDEYDAPILDYLGKDMAKALENREILRDFYTALKEFGEYIELTVLTGVSKFSRVGIFSGLNNLQDISMSQHYATMLGYTQEEVEANFEKYIADTTDYLGLSYDEVLEKMCYWYNGYRFHERAQTVYNPWSVQTFLEQQDIRNYWFTSGTPTFLVNLMREKGLYATPGEAIPEDVFSTFEPDNLSAETLLYQSGYLTIRERLPNGLYVLDYPNYEVHESLNKYLFPAFSGVPIERAVPFYFKVKDAFEANDLPRVIELLETLYAGISYEQYKNLAPREAFYHATLHLLFDYIGLMARSEETVAIGRIDTVVETPTHVYLLEFKVDQSAAKAVQQVLDRKYYQKFLHRDKVVMAVGINFSNETKNIEGWQQQVLYPLDNQPT